MLLLISILVSTECLATVPVIERAGAEKGIGERQRSQSAEHSHRFICCSKVQGREGGSEGRREGQREGQRKGQLGTDGWTGGWMGGWTDG